MGASTLLLWTVPCPWRPPNVILRSSWEHFWEMFLIRTRDDRGSEDRSCTIDNGCFELVERCRYVIGGMEFVVMALWSTSVIFLYFPHTLNNFIILSLFLVCSYPSILALISFCNTEVNHTCFDGTIKYYQPPHNFYLFCTLEIFLCKIPLYKRFSTFFAPCHNQHQHRRRSLYFFFGSRF